MNRSVLVLFLAGVLGGCGGSSKPRKPEPPPRADESLRREMFILTNVKDEWFEPLPIINGLEKLGGVVECEQDLTTGKYVVVFNPQRTNRDKIRQKIIDIGKEQGRTFDPIFDDR